MGFVLVMFLNYDYLCEWYNCISNSLLYDDVGKGGEDGVCSVS